MIDLHTHSLFSDGELLPSELVYRAKVKGYEIVALTDHADFSNFDFVIPRIKNITNDLSNFYNIVVIPGVEITYVPPKLISKAVKISRKLGAKIVIVHGETVAETVPKLTNHYAILAEVDILAHPGYLSIEDAKLAAKKNVFLEITTRKGHNTTNKHVARIAKLSGAKLVFNTDTHGLDDLMNKDIINKTLKKSNLTQKDFFDMQNNARQLISKLGG
jgi:histidinol phosphatase-like PHP family hydrolase